MVFLSGNSPHGGFAHSCLLVMSILEREHAVSHFGSGLSETQKVLKRRNVWKP